MWARLLALLTVADGIPCRTCQGSFEPPSETSLHGAFCSFSVSTATSSLNLSTSCQDGQVGDSGNGSTPEIIGECIGEGRHATHLKSRIAVDDVVRIPAARSRIGETKGARRAERSDCDRLISVKLEFDPEEDRAFPASRQEILDAFSAWFVNHDYCTQDHAERGRGRRRSRSRMEMAYQDGNLAWGTSLTS